MPVRRAMPIRFVPKGLSDTLEEDLAFPGACAILTNLIPDPTTQGLLQCRPASIALTTFASFTTPGFISVMEVIGTRVYGMISTGNFAGKDEPFCYDLVAGAFVAITGATANNTPTSPATSGTWTPPTMALVGTKLVFTHPGFPSIDGSFFGWIDTSDPGALTWTAGNTTANNLPAVPTWVAQFNGRAWFGCNPATGQPSTPFTDVLTLAWSTTTNSLTYEDNQKLTAAAGLPLDNQLGGIIQALIVFKGSANGYQVTGDAALSTLSRNALNIATGTNSPRSIVPTSKGLAFVAPDGLRLIDFNARVSDPIGIGGKGVNVPLLFSNVPTRVVSACNANVLRISVQNGAAAGTPWQEYWYDIAREMWTGPHSFPASAMVSYGNTFIMAPVGVTGALYQSDAMQSLTSSFTENAVAMSFKFQTALLAEDDDINQFALGETAVDMALAAGQSALTVIFADQDGTALSQVNFTPGGTASIWGVATWGTSLWGAAGTGLSPRKINWDRPVEYRKGSIQISGNSVSGFKLGKIVARRQSLSYFKGSTT